MKRHYTVYGYVTAEVIFEEDLIERFLPNRTLEDLAKHLAWCMGILGSRLSDLDGFADRPDSDAELVGNCVDVEWDEVEEITS